MVASPKYAEMTDEELVAANSALDEKRGKAVADVKEEQMKIQDEISMRATERKFDNLNDEEKAALRKVVIKHDESGE